MAKSGCLGKLPEALIIEPDYELLMIKEGIQMAHINYWDSYYSNRPQSDKLIPSQFAVFVANELQEKHQIIEFGCGNGRDSFFFADLGHDVLAIDASQVAIDLCKKYNATKVNFLCNKITDLNHNDILRRVNPDLDLLIYSRFFLHAITENDENSFFELISKIKDNFTLAVEFRANKDAMLIKETSQHFRRFINPLELLRKIQTYSLEPLYYVEGFGYAKYKKDDAYVARIVAKRTI